MPDSRQEVTVSVSGGFWLSLGGFKRRGSPNGEGGGRKARSGGRRAWGRRGRRRRRCATTLGERGGRRWRDGALGERGRWGRGGGIGREEDRRGSGRGGVKSRGGRGRWGRGRGQVGPRATGSRRGHGRGWRRVCGAQNAGALLGWCSVLSVIPANESARDGLGTGHGFSKTLCIQTILTTGDEGC